MDFKHVYRSLISKCSTEEEKSQIRQEYLSLAKLSGSNMKEAIEFMKKVEEEMNVGREESREA